MSAEKTEKIRGKIVARWLKQVHEVFLGLISIRSTKGHIEREKEKKVETQPNQRETIRECDHYEFDCW